MRSGRAEKREFWGDFSAWQFGCPLFQRHKRVCRQLVTMVKWGMTPAQALRAVTIRGAELMQMQNAIGTIEAGKYADIIAVQGNPRTTFP
jgi:imidazolonepropionase-like amidohydrolase